MLLAPHDLYDLHKLTGTVKGIYFVAKLNVSLKMLLEVIMSLTFQPLFLDR